MHPNCPGVRINIICLFEMKQANTFYFPFCSHSLLSTLINVSVAGSLARSSVIIFPPPSVNENKEKGFLAVHENTEFFGGEIRLKSGAAARARKTLSTTRNVNNQFE